MKIGSIVSKIWRPRTESLRAFAYREAVVWSLSALVIAAIYFYEDFSFGIAAMSLVAGAASGLLWSVAMWHLMPQTQKSTKPKE